MENQKLSTFLINQKYILLSVAILLLSGTCTQLASQRYQDSVHADNLLDSALHYLDSRPDIALSHAKNSLAIQYCIDDSTTIPYTHYLLSTLFLNMFDLDSSYKHAVIAYNLNSIYENQYPIAHLTILINYHFINWQIRNSIYDIVAIDKLIENSDEINVPHSYKCSILARLTDLYSELGDLNKLGISCLNCLNKCTQSPQYFERCQFNYALIRYSSGCNKCLLSDSKELMTKCNTRPEASYCNELKHLLGRMHYFNGECGEALKHITPNLKDFINPYFEFNQYLLLSRIYSDIGQNDSSVFYINSAEKVLEKKLILNHSIKADFLLHKARHYYYTNRLDSSHKYLSNTYQILLNIDQSSTSRGRSLHISTSISFLELFLQLSPNNCDQLKNVITLIARYSSEWTAFLSDPYSRMESVTYFKSVSQNIIHNIGKIGKCDNISPHIVYWVDRFRSRELSRKHSLYKTISDENIRSKLSSIENRRLRNYTNKDSIIILTEKLNNMTILSSMSELEKLTIHLYSKINNPTIIFLVYDTHSHSIYYNGNDISVSYIDNTLLHPDSSHTLYKKIFPENFDWSQYDHLTIVPDGPFHKYSFESMLTDDKPYDHPRDAPYLIKKIPISYSLGLHLARDFSEFDNESVRSVTFAPSFDQEGITSTRDCNEDNYSQLKCNQKEAQEVANILDGEAFLNKTATVANFKQNVDKYNFFHLATHACIDTNNYFESSLIFQDGRLSMSELYETDWNNKTVVLSACNTAKGAHVNGEGIFNFARTLTELGCKEVIVSLWPIDDCGTRDFIKLFYSHIQEGETTAKALQSARLKYLETADKLHAQPHFWAPLILISNDLNVGQTNNPSYVVWIVLLCLSILISSLYLFSAVRNKRTS